MKKIFVVISNQFHPTSYLRKRSSTTHFTMASHRFKIPVIPGDTDYCATQSTKPPVVQSTALEVPRIRPSSRPSTSDPVSARDRARMIAVSYASEVPVKEILDVYVAAKEGDAKAEFRLSSIYGCAIGVVDGISVKYEKYLRSAAVKGVVEAQYTLGAWLRKQNPEDYRTVVCWYAKAAEAGHSKALYNLGLLVAAGKGVKQNTEAALKLFRKADATTLAEKGVDIQDVIRKFERHLAKEKEREAACSLLTLCPPQKDEKEEDVDDEKAADEQEYAADERAACSLMALSGAKGEKPTQNSGRWSEDEHARYLEGLSLHSGVNRMAEIAEHVGTRTNVQVRTHHQKFSKRARYDSSDHSPKRLRA